MGCGTSSEPQSHHQGGVSILPLNKSKRLVAAKKKPHEPQVDARQRRKTDVEAPDLQHREKTFQLPTVTLDPVSASNNDQRNRPYPCVSNSTQEQNRATDPSSTTDAVGDNNNNVVQQVPATSRTSILDIALPLLATSVVTAGNPFDLTKDAPLVDNCSQQRQSTASNAAASQERDGCLAVPSPVVAIVPPLSGGGNHNNKSSSSSTSVGEGHRFSLLATSLQPMDSHEGSEAPATLLCVRSRPSDTDRSPDEEANSNNGNGGRRITPGETTVRALRPLSITSLSGVHQAFAETPMGAARSRGERASFGEVANTPSRARGVSFSEQESSNEGSVGGSALQKKIFSRKSVGGHATARDCGTPVDGFATPLVNAGDSLGSGHYQESAIPLISLKDQDDGEAPAPFQRGKLALAVPTHKSPNVYDESLLSPSNCGSRKPAASGTRRFPQQLAVQTSSHKSSVVSTAFTSVSPRSMTLEGSDNQDPGGPPAGTATRGSLSRRRLNSFQSSDGHHHNNSQVYDDSVWHLHDDDVDAEEDTEHVYFLESSASLKV